MRNLSLLAVLCLLTATLYAQSPSAITRFTLQGQAVDTASVPLGSSTVMLLSAKDSSLVNFTRTGDNGAFSFKNIKVGNYVLKISFVGFIPYNQVIKPSTEAVIDLGKLKLKPITRELMEVVVRTAKAPLTIKGDTIEYNASSFKVPPGSTVEDLLRKLPGVQIDQDGNIKAQGQDVKKLTVDGKNFFGNDPKQATKNLQAEAITKVQVFNDKTEQAKLTGVDDGKKEKTINLELKEEFKKGGFGKITAAAGPASNNVSARAEVKGIYNKFNSKHQFSLVGLGNNTNQQGLSQNDYQDFRGSNAYNSNQNADFGFSGGNFFYFSDSGDEGLGIPVSGRQGVGFSNNAAGGANYNFDTKEKKWSGSYYYNQTRLELNANRNRNVSLPQSEYTTDETSNQVNFNGNHRVSLRYEKQIDTLNTLLFINNSRYGVGNARLFRIQDLARSNGATTHNESTNGSDQKQFSSSNSLIYRHKMKSKKGRSLAASATYEVNTNNANLILDSQNTYSGPITAADKSADIHQDQHNNIVRSEYKASLQYVEPFAKRFTWETFYNFSLRNDEVDRDVFNRGDGRYIHNDTLSLYYKNNYVYNRLGSSVRYSYKGLNVSVGLAGQRFTLNGQFAPDQTAATFTPISRVFTTMIPNVGLNYDLKNNKYLYGGYNVSVQIPTSLQLQPIRNNSNPLFINEGNPDLLPQLGHNINIGFNYFNPGSFMNLYVGMNGTKYVNQIVNSQTTNAQTLVTVIKPENLSGGQNFNSYLGFGFPLKKTKATLDLNANVSLGKNPAKINDVLNEAKSQGFNAGGRLSLTPVDWLTFYGNANFGVTTTEFSISSIRNQFINNNFGGELTLKLPHDFYINTTLNYRISKNTQLDFDQRIPIWNGAMYHILGKAKRAEIRLTATDMLNRNVAVSLNRGANYTQSETIQTLARYFTIGFTYNMRGVQAKMRRDGFF
ncbi:TonB-dependent receptor [Spirosoma sp. KCTC 42546]|uniref:TonB-dependent receptor domain-containing protein n=1 Tax=Spirosoma sp. KCTC 42546 TaxID=2520506 RepID=UPI00115B12C7|nr:TonB-dependent receptor [Spirosoma sp. KCTC 42546]QDK82184.1 TonB-dependent receptor [Spirosoma sp. KCTC 42546]